MTHVIQVRNVNHALPAGLQWLLDHGNIEDSRNGRVLVSPVPVITVYERPWERVLFSKERDANPFFHFMEGLWMLMGRNDVAFPAYYAANIASFSDDGVTVAGAYGDRWRNRFKLDQLQWIIGELAANPTSRRCVLAMWDAAGQECLDGSGKFVAHESDLFLAMNGGKDTPCNTHIYFDMHGGKLNMTVCCRSNDAVWGAYGANAVHFSMLHEYVARHAGHVQGVYRQFSNNFHCYLDREDTPRLMTREEGVKVKSTDLYAMCPDQPLEQLVGVGSGWDVDCARFFRYWEPGVLMPSAGYAHRLFADVAVPLANAHHLHKAGDHLGAMAAASDCAAWDWRVAAGNWLIRREEKKRAPSI